MVLIVEFAEGSKLQMEAKLENEGTKVYKNAIKNYFSPIDKILNCFSIAKNCKLSISFSIKYKMTLYFQKNRIFSVEIAHQKVQLVYYGLVGEFFKNRR